jgi:hypothetical protein
MSDPKPRGRMLATVGLLLAITSPFVLLMLPMSLPPYGFGVPRDLRPAVRAGALLWIALGFLLPCVTLWLAKRRGHAGAALGRIGLAVFVLGMAVAVISIPMCIRMPAWESMALGDIRTVVSGQSAYQSANLGYGTLDCLVKPESCNPGYNGPAFLEPTLLEPKRRRLYTFTFHPGPAVDEAVAKEKGAARGLLQRYAYSASSEEPEYFPFLCGDDTGRICRMRDAAEVKVTDARCPEACQTIQ